MENDTDVLELTTWVNDRLATLDEASDWRPDVEHALERVLQRERRLKAKRRLWGWVAPAATAACLAILAVPAIRMGVENFWGYMASLSLRVLRTSVDDTGLSGLSLIGVCQWIESTWLSTSVRESIWFYWYVEGTH